MPIENIDITQESSIDFLKIHKESLIDPKEEIIPDPCLSFGKDWNGQRKEIVSYGNFMCIVGASKSMKSFLRSALEACYLQQNSHFDDFIGHNRKGRYLISFDTEQGKRHVQRVYNRVNRMISKDDQFFKTFSLRKYSPQERLKFIEWIFYESDYKGKIGLCTIDGVADLVDNVNDLDKSNVITQKLMEITEKTNSAIITVIHRNYESQKPTGHLGSSVLKKAETVLFVDKAEEIVRVKCQYSRNIPIDDFSFSVNQVGIPEFISDNIF